MQELFGGTIRAFKYGGDCVPELFIMDSAAEDDFRHFNMHRFPGSRTRSMTSLRQ